MEINNTKYYHERLGGKCRPEDIAPYMVMSGSKEAVKQFASKWENATKIAEHYEFLIYTGVMDGVEISACSTGCGGRSVAIVMDEMTKLGAHTFLRIGRSGPIQKDVSAGDVVIASSAVRSEKTSQYYAELSYPAIAHFEVVLALISAAETLGYPYHVGVVATAASMYAGQGITCHKGYRHSKMDTIVPDLKAANVLDWDTETATVFMLCSMYGLRAGRIDGVVDNPETGEYDPAGAANAIEIGLLSIKMLADWDREKEKRGVRYILPRV